MREVNLAGVDLNLLPALEALLKRRNVSHAAEDVGLSQPAMSRALARLREVLGDALLVRVPGGGYALTPRAEALSAQLITTLDHVKAFFREPSFDPAKVQRTIRIAGIDTHTILLAPALMARLATEAPGIDIRFENYGPDLIERVETGRLDLAFATANTPLPPGARSESYAHDKLVLVLRKNHPMAKKKWAIEDYGKVSHVGISILGDAGSELDAQLAKVGVHRRMALVTPHFIAALAAVAGTDMATTLSRVFATRFADQFGLVMKEPPLPNIDLELTVVWSHLRAADPVLAWVRGVMRDVAKETMDLAGSRVSRRAEKL
ncbi:MAG: LysR family transcriptional regulator [Hyphomonadaceae bacterium]|nr:LysR family transcriptional regulator [Hyphomonadaceae bacterium]